MIRRIRGVAGTALTWAVTWSALAFPVFGLLLHRFGAVDIAIVAGRWGLAGAGTGATFALLVMGFERRQTLATFGPTRAAAWGGVAGSGYAALTIARFLVHIGEPSALVATSIVVGGTLGTVSAALSVVAARRSAAMTRGSSKSEIFAQVT